MRLPFQEAEPGGGGCAEWGDAVVCPWRAQAPRISQTCCVLDHLGCSEPVFWFCFKNVLFGDTARTLSHRVESQSFTAFLLLHECKSLMAVT